MFHLVSAITSLMYMIYSNEPPGDRTELSGGLWYHDCQRDGEQMGQKP